MKIMILAAFAISFVSTAFAQKDTLKPKVYHWAELNMQKDSSRDRAQVLDAGTYDLDNLEIHVSTLDPGKAPHPPHTHTDTEELVIIKEGTLKVTVKGQSRLLGPGSIAFAMPGDEHGFENAGKTKATYYVLKFKSRSPMDINRAKKAGGSFMIDWNDLQANKTDKGERKNVFERPTSQFAKFEMHVTSLNAGEVSHPAHQHVQEEIILLRAGSAQMQVGNSFIPFNVGDLVFLNSGVLHALKNMGTGPCEYFAFQFH